MAFPICNFSPLQSVEELNSSLNIGLEDGYCDSTYLGHLEIPVRIIDEDDRFFGTHIREAIKILKELFKK